MRHVDRLMFAIPRWESRGTPLAVGRTLLAVATLTAILWTPDRGLFGDVAGLSSGANCAGVGAISLWCPLATVPHGILVGRIVSVAVLLTVCSGYRPNRTCVPHWYVTFSLGSSMFQPQGGDNAAKAATLLLIPICLGDTRVWQWSRPEIPMAPRWRGSALAATFVTRLQVLVIYAVAVGTKLADPAWSHGIALYLLDNDPINGFVPFARTLSAPILGSYWPAALLSWAVIVAEAVIAVAIVGPRRVRRYALVVTVVLHLSIAVGMALPGFGITMIGLVTVAYAGRFTPVGGPQHATLTVDYSAGQ
ncbi:MAG TPA: hypothetical protein VFX16_27215 [Pseudonocardiaceae bacterium]|nr:hypothetical protein [Pseudonocardiaceae bacterium]